MSKPTAEQQEFRRIISRNVFLPLGLAALLSAVFVGLIFHLVSVSGYVNHSSQIIGRAYEGMKRIIDAETGVRGYLVAGKENFLEPYEAAIKGWNQDMDGLAELVADDPMQSRRVRDMRTMFADWQLFAKDVIRLKAENRDYRNDVLTERGKRKMDAIRSTFADIIRTAEFQRTERTQTAETSVKTSAVVVLLASLLFGAVIAVHGRRQLVLLSTTYGEALRKHVEQNRKLQEQEWLQSGQAELDSESRGDHPTDVLSSKILGYLVRRLGAHIGSLYIAEGDSLVRRAGFALPEEAGGSNAQYGWGESLVGQTALDQKILELSQVPETYFSARVSSGSGSAPSNHLILLPLIASNETCGLVELGFLNAPLPRVRHFLELVAEGVALTLKSARYRSKLQELLEESQRQSEELQAQQEELRSGNEELEEQARALRESQSKLENQQAELEQTNSQLGAQSRVLEIQAQDMKEANRQLAHAKADLERKARELETASQYKSQFLANMSHELRTPLNSTLILAQLLSENKSGNLQEEQLEYARTILASSNDLLNLINDILDLAKIEAGKIELVTEQIHLEAVANALDRTFRPLAETKKIGFEVELDPGTPEFIETDRQRLEQVLKNLLSNAVKFTSVGSVKLRISPSAQAGEVQFSVIDTGIGIAPEQHQAIFEAFRQGDGTTSRKYGGTGLGLTISQNFAQLLGGKIRLESELGKGSAFTLAIPSVLSPADSSQVQTIFTSVDAAPVATPIPSPIEPISSAKTPAKVVDDREALQTGDRILLVVEDDASFAKVLYDLSHDLKFGCLIAHTAEDGISLAEAFLPSAVILDVHLPDHSGLIVLDRLKTNPKTRHIPVHMISAHDQSKAALEMGAVGYLRKPANLADLKEVVAKLENTLSQDIKRVLVVEDNETQRNGICRLITDQGVQTFSASTGEEALRMLETTPFDCMIVDLKLPDMSGDELLEKMANRPSASHPPVIVYTGRNITREEERKLQKYSRSIIIKGARSPERLLNEVTLFLHRIESQMAPDQQRILQELRDREQVFEGRRILLVDDDVRNLFALSSALEAKGAEVETARNGLEAIEKIKSTPQVDLVLMDIMMPGMDGYQAMREIRKDPKFAKLPIIAVTAKAMRDDQEKCLEAGANDYLAKPIDLKKLLSLIRIWIPQ